MTEITENLPTIVLHESLESDIPSITKKIFLIFEQKRFDEFSEMWHFANNGITNNLYPRLQNNQVQKDVSEFIKANDYLGLTKFSQFQSNCLSEQNYH